MSRESVMEEREDSKVNKEAGDTEGGLRPTGLGRDGCRIRAMRDGGKTRCRKTLGSRNDETGNSWGH